MMVLLILKNTSMQSVVNFLTTEEIELNLHGEESIQHSLQMFSMLTLEVNSTALDTHQLDLVKEQSKMLLKNLSKHS